MKRELRIVRTFAASASELYEAWTKPEQLVQWMLPMPDCRTEVRLDVRVGGSFQIDMVANGTHYPHRGEYLTLEAPRRWRHRRCSGPPVCSRGRPRAPGGSFAEQAHGHCGSDSRPRWRGQYRPA
jgi:hypothetical protein